jgi:hypothetical protein
VSLEEVHVISNAGKVGNVGSTWLQSFFLLYVCERDQLCQNYCQILSKFENVIIRHFEISQ